MRSERKRSGGPAQIARIDVDLSALSDPLVVSELAGVPGRNDRLRISIGGIEIGDLTIDFVADYRLSEGREITRSLAGEIIAAANQTIVLDKALDLLAVRARSSRELAVRLRRTGALDRHINWAVERLVRQGLLDDAAYARQVARAKVLGGGVSRRKVVTVLRRRGVAADTAEEAIDATLSEVSLDEEDAALAAAQKRLRALATLAPAVRKQRLYAFLARRGFGSEVIRRVLSALLPRNT